MKHTNASSCTCGAASHSPLAVPGSHGFGDLAKLQAPVDWILHMFWTLLTRLRSQIPSPRPLDLAFPSDFLPNPPQQSSTKPVPF